MKNIYNKNKIWCTGGVESEAQGQGQCSQHGASAALWRGLHQDPGSHRCACHFPSCPFVLPFDACSFCPLFCPFTAYLFLQFTLPPWCLFLSALCSPPLVPVISSCPLCHLSVPVLSITSPLSPPSVVPVLSALVLYHCLSFLPSFPFRCVPPVLRSVPCSPAAPVLPVLPVSSIFFIRQDSHPFCSKAGGPIMTI